MYVCMYVCMYNVRMNVDNLMLHTCICTFSCLSMQFIANSEPTVPLTSIPSIRFGAGFLARTFARFVKDLVDVAKDIVDKKAPQVQIFYIV